MARPRLHPDRPRSSSERVQRFRSQRKRLEVHLGYTDYGQVTHFAERWGCSLQEVLTIAFRATLPVMRQANSTKEVFNQVRDALDAAGVK